MWHEIFTRYPPVSNRDYWQRAQYSPEKPLLRRFPLILKHTKILNNNVYDSAFAVSKLQGAPSLTYKSQNYLK
jgi:hypothetical protein